ncbi:MAG: DUF5069 domain-containing protein [Nitrospinales bacterium]
MHVLETIDPLNLNNTVPRSSKEKMAGIAHLPRMVDKARSFQNNTLGEYIYPCPLDRHILQYLEISSENFAKLAESHDDEEITGWAKSVTRSRYWSELDHVNGKILNRKVDPEDLSYFIKVRDKIDPTRTEVTTWDGLTDLEEGRI